jgi:RimJ/RimL family protein N-acetyltransferase
MTKYLKSDRISLYKFTDRHITSEYLGWLNDHEVSKYLCTGRLPVTKDDVFSPTGEKNLLFAVVYTENNASKYIGTISLHSIDWIARKGEVGYMIGDRNYWGKGVATEIIGLISNYAFDRLGLNKVTAGVVEGNIGSVKALEKNGFTQYGTNPQDYYLCGEFLGTHLFYKLRSDK